MRRRAIGSRTLTPNRNASPLVAFTKPNRTFIVVVLPAPFGPRKPKTSPAWTVKLRSFTASFFPCARFCAGYSTRKFLVSKIVSILAFDRQPHFGSVYFAARGKQEQGLHHFPSEGYPRMDFKADQLNLFSSSCKSRELCKTRNSLSVRQNLVEDETTGITAQVNDELAR